MGLPFKQPHNDLTTLNVVSQVNQVEININLVDELGHTRAIHFAVKGRRQRRLYSSGELGLGPVTKSFINGFLCIQISLKLRNLLLHVLQQLHELLDISNWLCSHNEYMHSEREGGTAKYVEFQYTQNTKMHTELQRHSRNQM